jgi:hypothetical protein
MLIMTEGSQEVVRREVLCALHASLSTLLSATLVLLFPCHLRSSEWLVVSFCSS